MIRKMLTIAAAASIPMSTLAIAGSSGVAGASAPIPLGSCSLNGTSTFAIPGGISVNGFDAKKAAYDNSTTITPTCGTTAESSSSWKTVLTSSTTTTVGTKTEYVVGTFAEQQASAPSDFVAQYGTKGIKVVLTGGVKATLLPTSDVSQSPIVSGTHCGGEVGNYITGTVAKSSDTFALTICISTALGSGSDFSPTALTDFADMQGHDPLNPGAPDTNITVTSATVDPASSYVTISS